MNQEQFEQEVLRVAVECGYLPAHQTAQEYSPYYPSDFQLTFASAIRDLVLRELAENNPPVAWKSKSGSLAYSKESFMPSTRDLATPLYAKPPTGVQER